MPKNTDNISNVRADYASGVVKTAPVGTTLPTGAGTSVDAAFKDWGAINSDGVNDTRKLENDKILDINGEVAFVVRKEDGYSVKFKPMELRAEILKVEFGDSNVDVDGNGDVTAYRINSEALDNRSYVFDFLLADRRKMRVVIPNGAISSVGEEGKKVSDVMGRELEVEALPDENGNKAYVYFANPTGSGANIMDYSIHALGMDCKGSIDQSAGEIAVTVPTGTTMTALVASFTLSNGASAKIGSTAQVSGTTSNNFSSPKTYTITAANGTTTKEYEVTVTAAQ